MYLNTEINWLKFLKDKEVFIWGAGIQGKDFAKKLEKTSIAVKGFIDNNSKFDGETIEGKKIYVPSAVDLTAVIDSKSYVIICSFHERKIKNQLLELGITNFISCTQLDFGGGAEFYDESYFEWQKTIGEDAEKDSIFHTFITTDMNVVEFGSGGGFLLSTIEAKEKMGIEINPYARAFAGKNGINSVENAEEIKDEWADIIISSHALEHVENPLGTLRTLRTKLKDGHKIVFVVPSENTSKEYVRSENNNHLYAWNPLTLGNLFKAAGFYVISVERVKSNWPSGYKVIRKEASKELFEEISRCEGAISDEGYIVIMAEK